MKTELKEVRIAGYKFVFEFDHNEFKCVEVRVFLGGKIYMKPKGRYTSAHEAELSTVTTIVWTFKR